MAMTLKIDKSVWENLKRNLLVGSNLENSTGFFPESRYGSENGNMQVAQVARDNSEGTVRTPPRDFMRTGFGGKLLTGKYKQLFQEAVTNIALGKTTAPQEYSKLAPIFASELKQVIIDWSTPPNSPATIAGKGFNDPLVNTGLMRDSVQSKVEPKDS